MPVGPSHSGRGGGGNHGGGFGGPRGGEHGGYRNPRPAPHHSPSSSFVNGMIGGMIGASIASSRRDRFERRYGIRPSDEEFNAMPRRNKPTLFLVLSIIVGFFALLTFMTNIGANSNLKSTKSSIQTMESDWLEYKTLIEKANETGTNGYYLTTAEFDKKKYNYYDDNPTKTGAYFDFEENGISYYFIVYEYEDERTGKDCTGTTYTQFSANEIQNLNGEIEIAYFSKAGNASYSINTSYKLNTCKKYLTLNEDLKSEKSLANGSLVALIIELVIIAGFIALYVLKLKNYYKLVAADEEVLFQKKKAEAERAQAEANEVKSRTNRYCKYCGSKIEPNAIKCSSCGANLTK